MSEYPIWSDESSRAVEVMGGEGIKYKRTVNDNLTLIFNLAEWRKIFNVSEGFLACSSEGKPYLVDQPIHIYFIRQVEEKRP